MRDDGERNSPDTECSASSDAAVYTPDPLTCCKCDSCHCCHLYPCYDFNIEFFIKPLSDHYNHLRQHVFSPLSTITEQWDDSFFPAKIIISLPKNSEFYDDARRHMSKKMKNNLALLDDATVRYNNYVESNTDKIKRIVESHIENASKDISDFQLSDDARRSLYSILRRMLQEVIRSKADIQERVQQFDMKSQAGYGLKPEDRKVAHTVFDSLPNDISFLNEIKVMREIIRQLLEYKDAVKTQAGEISIEMKNNTYRVKRRCCPILWTELWKIMGFSFR